MRTGLALALAICAVLQPSIAAPQQQNIAPTGSTSVSALIDGKAIEIKLQTFIAKKSDPWFPLNLDYYNELSFIQNMSISVQGKPLWVPRSSYADLFDARVASITSENGVFVLSITGADASDVYLVHIYFGPQRIFRRAVYGLEGSAKKPAEETRYSKPEVID